MLSTNTEILLPESAFSCAQCGAAVKPKTQMTSDAPTVCAKCRCRHCGIVLSRDVCRCGVRHGSPSPMERLCERCYALLDLHSHVEPEGIVAELLFAAADMDDVDDFEAENELFELEDDLYEVFVA